MTAPDPSWRCPPMPCRANLPLRIRDDAHSKAEAAGWLLEPGRDLCPAHARAAKETT